MPTSHRCLHLLLSSPTLPRLSLFCLDAAPLRWQCACLMCKMGVLNFKSLNYKLTNAYKSARCLKKKSTLKGKNTKLHHFLFSSAANSRKNDLETCHYHYLQHLVRLIFCSFSSSQFPSFGFVATSLQLANQQ
ncbi:hypothetical protein HELRODRAFT_162252 [Helobdella robusta]|uniref:Secreted protein n=1 Tax=Helobdella robusta TaxID=6412 RepID=T1ESF1_HELRO|nr:hypothetical protein HELRODRAFT_162252 [Helobdella robusta]ESN98792.1 hypothetical protein HELRODRAFT_162252 [Helobdella robusta]